MRIKPQMNTSHLYLPKEKEVRGSEFRERYCDSPGALSVKKVDVLDALEQTWINPQSLPRYYWKLLTEIFTSSSAQVKYQMTRGQLMLTRATEISQVTTCLTSVVENLTKI